ncbi:class I SAM-dependent methyltransferase [Haladaptatus sp. DYSN1]|uniref:class I SAM-dependent methyltransferase n=1 Tax=unclassified Haladaptatus TaxID=2622732 RepID=UPI002405169F|nr:class I SAM-dependent methyltransferase [Haladaptatus sp. DYSN1]
MLRKWYYVLNPKFSWKDRKKTLDTTEAFSTRFFGSEAQMKAYEDEFNASLIGPTIFEGIKQLPKGVSLFDAHKDECIRMYALIREYKPEVIVETGVYNGVSTLSILAALEANGSGRLYSIDYSDYLSNHQGDVDPLTEAGYYRGRPSCAEEGTHLVPAGKEPGWLVPEHLRGRWELISGKPQLELPRLLTRLEEIDFFHHDSSHAVSSMIFEFELAWQYLRPGGIMVSNHIGWNDAFETFVAEHSQDYGLMTWHYNPRGNYSCPGSSGYIVRSADTPRNGIQPGDSEGHIQAAIQINNGEPPVHSASD